MIVKGSAVPKVNPFKSNDAPANTIVPEAVVPSGELVAPPEAANLITPLLIVVIPEYVLLPPSDNAPVPVFVTRVEVAVPLLITPV